MRKIIRILLEQIKTDFQWNIYIPILVFTGFILTINYGFLEYRYISNMGEPWQTLTYFGLFSAGYFIPLFIYSRIRRENYFSKEFLVKVFLGIALLSLDSALPMFDAILGEIPVQMRFWGYKVAGNLVSFFIIFLPLLVIYRVYDRHEKHIYGLVPNSFPVRPYFILLGLMIPLILYASFQPSFRAAYPQYSDSLANEYLGMPGWVTMLIYELAYGADFITVELIFRGYFILALMNHTGRSTILATAVMYCFLHIGKPPLEAISSLFGGYILGTLAYATRLIWGGIIVHVGIAWMMEIAGYLQGLNAE